MAALYDDITALELRRLGELEKQAAMHGPRTEPEILIEIQDLRHKYGAATGPTMAGRFVRPPGQRDQKLDYDFLMNTVAGVLRRMLAIEERNKNEDSTRPRRQVVLNLWLGAISAALLLNIALTFWLATRLFGL